ncbi:MAG: Sua5/YciO/YrdC/YwlC family protein [Alphaproteobacteria bacterium]|jgi:tRNA A37 threonylcarbamoyladenosine synthetase subunit TsaC/SUA5/YrdC
MSAFDIQGDAKRAMDVILNGGIAIIPSYVGYVILGATTEAINKTIEVKERGPSKLNAVIGCASMHAALHVLEGRNREIVRTITQGYDLPMGTVAPADLNHPMMKNLDTEVFERTTLGGTIAMLLNAGPLMDAMADLSFEAGQLVVGSSANLSLHGTKFRAQDIEPQVLNAADIVIDYGLMRWANYGRSSTMVNVHDFSVVRYGSCLDLINDVLQRHYDFKLPPEPER